MADVSVVTQNVKPVMELAPIIVLVVLILNTTLQSPKHVWISVSLATSIPMNGNAMTAIVLVLPALTSSKQAAPLVNNQLIY